MRFILFTFFLFSALIGWSESRSSFEKIAHDIDSGDLAQATFEIQAMWADPNLSFRDSLQLLFLSSDANFILGDMHVAAEENDRAKELMDAQEGIEDLWYFKHHFRRANLAYEWQQVEVLTAELQTAYSLIESWPLEKVIKERAYLLWVLKAVSPKVAYVNLNREKREKICLKLEALIDLFEREGVRKHDIARTYHRLANAYADIMMGEELSSQEQQKVYSSYDKACDLWKELYGDKHYELARSTYVKGFVKYSTDGAFAGLGDFKEGLEAFNIDLNDLLYQPNKVEILMCYKYYVQSLIAAAKALDPSDENNYMSEAYKANQEARELWKVLSEEYSSERFNTFFARYGLNPEIDFLSIKTNELAKDESWKSEVFDSVQKLKYDDLRRSKAFKGSKVVSLSALQESLEPDELFLEVFYVGKNDLHALRITNTSCDFITQQNSKSLGENLEEAIITHDFNSFCTSSNELFNLLFSGVEIENYSRLIVADAPPLDEIPFAALLCSQEGVNTGNFASLDYLLKHWSVQHVLSASFYSSEQHETPFNLNVFVPEFDGEFSALPFSLKLAQEFEKDEFAQVFLGKAATKFAFRNNASAMVHISTHAAVTKAVYESKLHFSDSLLLETELETLNYCPDFFCLNACNTSNGRWLNGDGMKGFCKPLFKKGVKAVIANTWEVDDRVSNQIFSRMYHQLREGGKIDQTLRSVQLATLLEDNGAFASPYYWAGHRYYGQEIAISNQKNFNFNRLIFYLLGAFLVLLSLLCVRKARPLRSNGKLEKRSRNN
jgi:hypothetical protein